MLAKPGTMMILILVFGLVSWTAHAEDVPFTSHIVSQFSGESWTDDLDDVGVGSEWINDVVSGNFPGTWASSDDIDLADLDGDGDLDLIGIFRQNAYEYIYWWENENDDLRWRGHSIRRTHFSPTNAFAFNAADIDGDGDLDIAFAINHIRNIGWWENLDGTGLRWEEHLMDDNFWQAESIQCADLDGDGDLDLLSASSRENMIQWWENRHGDGSDWIAHSLEIDMDSPRSAHVGDVDGDGDLDLIGASSSHRILAWWENSDGLGNFENKHTINTGSINVNPLISTVDVDGDGDLDVIASKRYRPYWWENLDGQGLSWELHFPGHTIVDVSSVHTGDLDGDGDIDVMAFFANEGAGWLENRTIHRSASYPESGFHIVDDSFGGAYSGSAADIDGDGNLDLIGAAFGADDIAWWENTSGDGSSMTKYIVDDYFEGAARINAADMDGDGDSDLIAAGFLADQVAWWENTAGDGSSWTKRVVDDLFIDAYSVEAVDIDDDGDLDLIGSAWSDDVVWWENTSGDGLTWIEHTVQAFSGVVASVYPADPDGDGDPDIIGAAYDDDSVVWWENTAGDGSSWTAHTVDIAFAGAHSVFSADIDRDGDADLIGAAYGDYDIAWWENTSGDGMTWTRHGVDDDFRGAVSVRAEDLDLDGDFDLVGAGISDEIVWWENTSGDGASWIKHAVTDALDGSESVYAGDIDGDGDPDLIAAAYGSHDIAWFENRGGQYSITTTDLSVSPLGNRMVLAALEIEVEHLGHLEDNDGELASLSLLFEDGDGTPLTSAEAMALLEGVGIVWDDGDNVFDHTRDMLIASVTAPDLTDGVLTIDLPDGDHSARIEPDNRQTYFVVLQTTADASSQRPNSFRITHLTDEDSGLMLSRVEDRVHDIELSPQWSPDVSTCLMTVFERGGIGFP